MRPPIRTHSAVTSMLSAVLAALVVTAGLAVLGDTVFGSGDVTLAASSATITAISAGGFGYTCAATTDGAAWCWGGNSSGQLGNGTTTDSLVGVRVTKAGGANLTGVTALSAGLDHTCARTSDGAAWCWGTNRQGQLGDGTTRVRTRAVRVTKTGGGYLTGITAVSAAGSLGQPEFADTCARTSDGSAWCWGSNNTAQLGDGSTTDRHRAVRVTKAGGGYLTGVTAISAGGGASCARTSNGAAWCWGLNGAGQLGDGTSILRKRAIRVTKAGGGYLTAVTAISAGGVSACARTSDGAAWCWGDNEFGSLGDGTTTERKRAVRVTNAGGGYLTGVTAISAGLGANACAATNDGAAWCWGGNSSGSLGDGTTTERDRAVQVTEAGGGNLVGVTVISAGTYDTCARTSDGGAWCWGANDSGQLGDGTTTERDQAVLVTAI
jgi:alpha-tubulin suppressor-like RCC1 family protein